MDTETAKAKFAQDRFAALAGIEIIEAGAGHCTARMKIEDKHLNAAHIVQGGAIFTLADLAFAVAANSHGQLALAIHANISFLRSKSKGYLYATATEINDPKRVNVYDVMVTDEHGEAVAKFHGMVYRKK